MNTNYTNIEDVLRYDANPPVLTVDEEVALIVEAQQGDNYAFMHLLAAYGPLIRGKIAHTAKTVEREDVEGEAMVAFSEVVYTHDPFDTNYKNGRLSSRLPDHLTDRLGELQAGTVTTFSIPKRTYTRYYGILNKADGDFEEAMSLAPEMGMRQATFAEIHAMVQETTPVTGEDRDGEEDAGDTRVMRPLLVLTDSDAYDEAEDYLMVEVAFSAVDDEEARIVELAYGFRGTEDYAAGEPVPDSAIAARVGGSRATIQRKRGKALGKMRQALGVEAEG